MSTVRERSESGFTLVELLIAITVLGIIMAPLTAATVVSYRTMNMTANNLSSSSDAQLLLVYFPTDVKSADTATVSSITCTGVTLTNAKLQLTSAADAASGLPAVSIVYWVQVVGTSYQLVRSVCGSTPKTIVIARNLASVTSAVVSAVTVSSVVKGYSMNLTEMLVREPSAYTFTVSGRFRSGMST